MPQPDENPASQPTPSSDDKNTTKPVAEAAATVVKTQDAPATATATAAPAPVSAPAPAPIAPEVDEFGLPIVKKYTPPAPGLSEGDGQDEGKDSSAVTAQKRRESAASQKNRESVISQGAGPQVMSEYSHQQLTAPKEDDDGDEGDEWQAMPAYARYDMYDDNNKLIAKEHNPDEDERYGYSGLGGAGKGYTRVVVDDDAESETSMDDNTRYLFNGAAKSTSVTEMDEEARDAISQMQATKDLLTEGQRIAYVGVTRVQLFEMVKWAEGIEQTKGVKKKVQMAAEAMRMWAQKIMIRLYAHMEISQAEQVMIEQLAEHGVRPGDLTPVLMQNARVKNPMAGTSQADSPRRSSASLRSSLSPGTSVEDDGEEPVAAPPPPYENHEGEELPEVKTPSQLPQTDNLDIDLRWTVLCDLFLVLIADSIYDARSRVLLERVGKDLQVPWVDICRFEKRVTEALEMQQQAEKENWNEQEHIDSRQKMALRKRYVMMGLATAGGGLVIGLSAGLMAPLIGAGLAAGFTAIGVGGTSSFLAGAGGAAIITSGSVAAGSFMGGKAANRRTGPVKTFEYQPLHNNKRVNLIVTVSGWMTSKNDDVRLPFSTVDPLMGDLYSIFWEPDMLSSMGDTMNILATEAMSQTLQHLATIGLATLMAALQAPVLLAKLSYLIDNPWTTSLARAWAAGLILADSLIDRNLGTRPITLVGYSLGSRVIFSCLLELARKGAYGIVQDVYIFGAPMVFKKDEWLQLRTAVSGRIVNGYNSADWILGYLFRLTDGGIRRVIGLAPIEGIPGVENMDCKDFVVGHMAYREAMPRLLRECGWMVESDEFIEIDEPDPDQHRERQMELINEIEEARKEMEKKETKKSAWNFFGRKKGQRENWEVYEDLKNQTNAQSSKQGAATGSGKNDEVLFDVDAMRAELDKAAAREGESLEVKELKSTLPPMKLDVPSPTSSPKQPRDALRETKSDWEVNKSAGNQGGLSPAAAAPPPRYSYGGHDAGDDNNIQMTFDDGADWGAQRPQVKTAQTIPAVPTTHKMEHDPGPWGRRDHDDYDDDDFGQEKEISMTFA